MVHMHIYLNSNIRKGTLLRSGTLCMKICWYFSRICKLLTQSWLRNFTRCLMRSNLRKNAYACINQTLYIGSPNIYIPRWQKDTPTTIPIKNKGSKIKGAILQDLTNCLSMYTYLWYRLSITWHLPHFWFVYGWLHKYRHFACHLKMQAFNLWMVMR